MFTFEPITGRPIRVALVGCGRISRNHFTAINALSPDLQLVAVCDSVPARFDAIPWKDLPNVSSSVAPPAMPAANAPRIPSNPNSSDSVNNAAHRAIGNPERAGFDRDIVILLFEKAALDATAQSTASTFRVMPSAPTMRTLVPAGRSGPLTSQ